jgi:hypothetical protein
MTVDYVSSLRDEFVGLALLLEREVAKAQDALADAQAVATDGWSLTPAPSPGSAKLQQQSETALARARAVESAARRAEEAATEYQALLVKGKALADKYKAIRNTRLNPRIEQIILRIGGFGIRPLQDAAAARALVAPVVAQSDTAKVLVDADSTDNALRSPGFAPRKPRRPPIPVDLFSKNPGRYSDQFENIEDASKSLMDKQMDRYDENYDRKKGDRS